MGTDGSSLGLKRPGREADHSSKTNFETECLLYYIANPLRLACTGALHLPWSNGGKYNQTYKILWASRMWHHVPNYTTSHPKTPCTSYSRQWHQTSAPDIWLLYKAENFTPNSASMNVSRLLNVVREFQPNTIVTAEESGFEFTSPQRTDRFCIKRTAHLHLVQRMLHRPPYVFKTWCFTNYRHNCIFSSRNSIHKCPADGYWMFYCPYVSGGT
jgi:hypothetical protein